MLASYACKPEKTNGRLYPEKPTPYRSEFQRDKDRIIHSNTFRRLQYKTQVFINHEGDHYRNRLTHSIEVASIARSLARDLGASEDLAECISLAHDLGHTPFGHAGEHALHECMKNYQGFDHNAHAIRLLTKLEKRYASYEGLNLTWEVIEGTAKHNGPLKGDIPIAILEYNKQNNLKLDEYSSIESQVSSFSDDIAYNCHDLEDGIRANMFTIDDLMQVEGLKYIVKDVQSRFPNEDTGSKIFEIVRELAHVLIEDLLYYTKKNISEYNVKSCQDIRSLGKPIVAFSQEIQDLISNIRSFLWDRVYGNYGVILVRYKCQKVVKELFDMYFNNPECMPPIWKKRAYGDEIVRARAVADYIAGMTDRFAIDRFNSLSLKTNF